MPASKTARALGAALCLLTLVFPAAAGELLEIDGVPHIRNDAEPSDGRRTIQLEEIWRIGGDDEEGLLLGLVSEVGGDADGNVYVMDAQLCQVHVFSPEGEHLRSMFRQGEGPGEVYRPRDLVLLPEGVGLAEEFPGKITVVDYEGLPHSRIAAGSDHPGEGGNPGFIGAHCGGGNLVCSGTLSSRSDQPGIQKRTCFLASFARDGVEKARYLEQPADYNFNDFTFSERIHTPSFWWGFTVGPDGRVYACADRDRYAVSVFAPDGALERVIEREHESVKRSGDEKSRMRKMYESALPPQVNLIIEDYEPAVSYWHRPLHVDEEGRLWVITTRGVRDQPEGVLLTYDVFDPAGHFIEQVAVPCEGNGLYDCLFWISSDSVVLVTGYMSALAAQFGQAAAVDTDEEEATPQEIIYFRIKS